MSHPGGGYRPHASRRRLNAAFDRRSATLAWAPSVKPGNIWRLLVLLLWFWIFQAPAQSDQPRFFLPKNPVAAAYVLNRLSNQELIAAPRGEFVYTALLQRPGLDRKYRLESLDGLAKIRHTDRLTELLRAITELDKKAADSNAVPHDLGSILLESSRAELLSKQTDLNQLTTQAQLAETRQLGWAARALAEQNAAKLWREAQAEPRNLGDLLLGIPLIPDSKVREAFYPAIQGLLRPATAPRLLEPAAQSVVSIPGHEVESFQHLARLLQAGVPAAGVLASLARIPSASWPTNELGSVAEALVGYLKQVPTERRAYSGFASALEFGTELAGRLPAADGRRLTKELRALGPLMVTVRAIYEQMRFDKTAILVEAGKPIVVTLQNEDAMPHNLAILAPGALKEIGLLAEKMPPEPDAQGRLYVPSSPKVLHATKLVSPGQKLQLAFTAPTQPGDYPYACTFPGHWLRMSGTLTVVADIDAYLAAHPLSQQPSLTEWKLADFAAELPQTGAGNPAAGRELFAKLACITCHKLGSEGYGYGPDLTDVFKRYKGSRSEVLQQILEPSLHVDERYRNYNFDLKGGDSLTGMVLKEDDQKVTIQSGPADSLIQAVKKSEIERRSPQGSSPMPVGLLNALSKPQIIDLLSYVEAGGNVSAHEHDHFPRHTAADH